MLIIISLIIIGFVSFVIGYITDSDFFTGITAFSVIGLFIAIFFIIGANIAQPYSKIKWNNRYQGLLYKIENQDELSITGLELVNEVVEFNNDYELLIKYHNSLWLNWFNPIKEIEDVKVIDLNEEKIYEKDFER